MLTFLGFKKSDDFALRGAKKAHSKLVVSGAIDQNCGRSLNEGDHLSRDEPDTYISAGLFVSPASLRTLSPFNHAVNSNISRRQISEPSSSGRNAFLSRVIYSLPGGGTCAFY